MIAKAVSVSDFLRILSMAIIILALAACAGGKKKDAPGSIVVPPAAQANPHKKIGNPYKVAGIWYYPAEDPGYDRTGIASWYGPTFHGRKTANGEIFDMNRLTAAHPTLPLPSIVQVTNVKNGRTVNVRLNDRGPFAHGRLIDMSREAAIALGFKDDGLAEVRVRYLGPASLDEAITALGQPESYADGTYAMPKDAVLIAANDLDTVHTRISSGPEIKSTEPISTADQIDGNAMEAIRTSVRATERQVREEIVTGSGDFFEDEPVSLPDFNEVLDVVGGDPASDVWVVQIGAFSSRHNAEQAASRFGKTIPVHREEIVTSSGTPLTLVRLGPYLTQSDAETALKVARHSGFGDARIVAP